MFRPYSLLFLGRGRSGPSDAGSQFCTTLGLKQVGCRIQLRTTQRARAFRKRNGKLSPSDADWHQPRHIKIDEAPRPACYNRRDVPDDARHPHLHHRRT